MLRNCIYIENEKYCGTVNVENQQEKYGWGVCYTKEGAPFKLGFFKDGEMKFGQLIDQ